MERVVGIDLGIRTIACSSGEVYQQPYFEISSDRKSREGVREVVRKLTVDWLNSIATQIVISYDVIYIEKLDKSILDTFKETAFDKIF